jgi:ATP synthase protein I
VADLIPQKNQFSEAGNWDEPEKELFRVLSKVEMESALKKNSVSSNPPLLPRRILAAQVTVTLLSMLFWSVFGGVTELSIYTQSAFLGGLVCVLPSALFLIRLELAKKTQILNPRRYVAALVTGELIKISATLMLFFGIAYLIPSVLWVPLLVTYVLALKCVWLAWLWR